MEETQGIVTAVVAVVGFGAAMLARWAKTNPENPWYVRLAVVFDVTQIFDGTRRLDD